ncbi:hypothetical protein BS47DRAFT_1434291 [Hydnum rufescens UP504]|uniref:Uncharacterized protein n=1 Tax=Hydnum rufescens UP504 TaxID=1448309 RepID=A0A9P6DIZ8_9AGAM|nr:hypothetical protein BS47DRAFT_1434291 [Hydnum rufescens UP504]
MLAGNRTQFCSPTSGNCRGQEPLASNRPDRNDRPDHHRYRTLVTAFKHPPPLHKLGVLLSVLLSEFLHLPHLLLLSDDSYFYCLAIYENLVELGEGEYIARAPRQFAHEAREWVKMRMQTSQNRSSRPSSSLPNLQHGPIPLSTDALSGLVEAPDLTGRIFRLDSSAFATGGYSSVWRGSLPSATPNDPNGSLRVVIKVLRASHTNELTAEWKLHKVVLSNNCAMDVLFIIGHSVCIEKCEYGPDCATIMWSDC